AEEAARKSQQFLQSALNALAAYIAILDGSGTIVAVNASWPAFAPTHPFLGATCSVGAGYLRICEQAEGPGAQDMHALGRGVRTVLAEQRDDYYQEYHCNGDGPSRWFSVRVTR